MSSGGDGYIKAGMSDDREPAPDLDMILAAQADDRTFATPEEAQADFEAKLDAAIADADAGRLLDADDVFDRLQQRYENWPRAAE